MKKVVFQTLIFIALSSSTFAQSWFPQTSGTTKDLHSVFFLNENLGWVAGSNGVLLKTVDGGNNWAVMPNFTFLGLSSVFFINENIGWATVGSGRGEIHKTTDGGITWTRQHQTIFPGYTSIKFINPDTGWATYGYNDYAKIMKTTNGGTSWYQVYIDSYAYSVIIDVFFVNPNIGWAIGDYKILKSVDGGENWTLQYIIPGNELRSVNFISDSVGWVSGKNGKIFKTTNGGDAWVAQNTSTIQYLRDIQFVNENAGWAVGYGVILKTIDGGNNWILSFSGFSHLSLHFESENIGWVVGAGGKIFKTIDGGALPVELTSFTVNCVGRKVHLSWSTATELNNYGFEVERSYDKISWSSIGFREGKGTTTEPQSYTFSENISDLSNSTIYYRLKQVDYNRSFEYSDVVEIITSPTNFVLDQNYPNPFNPSTSIQYAIASRQFVTLKVYDILGNEIAILVNEEKPTGRYEVDFQSTVGSLQLASGVYYYQLRAGSFIETKKMILLR